VRKAALIVPAAIAGILLVGSLATDHYFSLGVTHERANDSPHEGHAKALTREDLAGDYADLTLFRTDEGGYFVHLDARKSGDNAVLEVGAFPRGLSEHDIRCMWPELFEAQRRQ
jgi:hypothetical protein